MKGYGLTFHHLGLATRRPERAHTMLTGLGYAIPPSLFDPEQNVNLSLCEHPVMPAVEVISPGEGPGPLDGLLKRFEGGLVYHCCYEAADVAHAVEAIKGDGLRILPLVPPKPAVLFSGRLVSFYQVTGFGLIELLQGQAAPPS